MLEELHNVVALVTGIPTDRLFIFVTLVALGLVGYALHVVRLTVVKSLSTRGKD